MSGSITMTGVTGYATLARLIQDSEATHRRLDNLTNQVSTGLVADNYAGLGNGASVSLDLRPQIWRRLCVRRSGYRQSAGPRT